MSDTSHILVLRVDGLDIPVEVVRKRVKNLNLRVRGNGSVTLSIPQRIPLAHAEEFLDRKGAWIAERVRRYSERPSQQDLGNEVSDHIPLWGDLVPWDSVLPCRARTERGKSNDAAGAGEAAKADQGALHAFYRSEVQRELVVVAKRLEQRIGVRAARWSVRVMKTRWGSCTPKTGAIRINARLAAYPPECLEFVVTHELVHLLEPSHNARFHALLDEFCPNNRRLAKRLREAPSPNSSQGHA